MAKNKKKNSNITPKMSINEILHYFKCFFEADEILKFATDRVAKDFLVFQSYFVLRCIRFFHQALFF